MSNKGKIKELHTKLQKEYSNLSFNLENKKIKCQYKNGVFVFTDISNKKIYGITVQYRMYCKDNTNENEILKCLNEINSEHNLIASFDMSDHINFAPIYVPVSNTCIDIDTTLKYFNRMQIFLQILEDDDHFVKLKELLK